MPEADGEVVYQVRADTESLHEDLDKAHSEAKKGAEKLKSLAGGTAKAVGVGFVAIGTAAVTAGGYTVNLANDVDKAMNSFAASTGASKAEMEDYQNVLEKIYANNYGEDFQDIADSMALVKKNLGDLSDEQLQNITESAFTLRDTFEYDITESSRAAKAMIDNFGISGEEAMNLIAAGAQNGLDYSGELIDSINEYSVQFAKIGFSADDMFKIFEKGAESGAFNLDKVGDAVKEFSIRAIDGSDSTKAGFTSLGLNADEMAAKFSKGGESAKSAFKETVKALASIEDPLAQNTAGVNLFGTMWEDLGPEAVKALADIEDGAYDTGDALNEIKKVKYNDLSSMLEGLKRSVEMLAVPLGEMLIPVLNDIIQDTLPLLQELLPILIENIEEFLPPLLQTAQEILPVILDLINQLMPVITQMMNEVLPLLLEAVQLLLPVFMQIIQELLPPMIDLFTQLMPIIIELASALIPPLVAIFEALIPVILQIIDALLPPLISLFKSLTPAIEALTPVIEVLAKCFSKTLSEAVKNVMPIIESIIDVLKNVINFISDVFKGDWDAAWNDIKNVVVSIFNGIISAIQSGINGAIGLINSMINGVNKITGVVGLPEIPNISDVSLPKFHAGGIVDFSGNFEGLAMLKSGEMVLTSEQQKRLFDIANGFNYPMLSEGYSSVNNQSSVVINNNQVYNVRDEYDIQRISEDINTLEKQLKMGKGG